MSSNRRTDKRTEKIHWIFCIVHRMKHKSQPMFLSRLIQCLDIPYRDTGPKTFRIPQHNAEVDWVWLW